VVPRYILSLIKRRILPDTLQHLFDKDDFRIRGETIRTVAELASCLGGAHYGQVRIFVRRISKRLCAYFEAENSICLLFVFVVRAGIALTPLACS